MADLAVAEPSEPSERVLDADGAAPASRLLPAGKVLATLFSVLVIGAMLSAVLQNWQARPRDSFPLSYFPMFSYEFDELQTEHYLIGRDALGNRHAIHYNNIAPGGSVVRIRRETVRAMVKRGQSKQLCQDASQRIAERNPRSLRSVVSLEVMTGTFSLSEYLQGNKTPASEKVQATCSIRR